MYPQYITHCFAHSIPSVNVWWVNTWEQCPHDVRHNIISNVFLLLQNLGPLCRLPSRSFTAQYATHRSLNSELFPLGLRQWHLPINRPGSGPLYNSFQWQSLRRPHMCLQHHQIHLVKALMVLNDNLVIHLSMTLPTYHPWGRNFYWGYTYYFPISLMTTIMTSQLILEYQFILNPPKF